MDCTESIVTFATLFVSTLALAFNIIVQRSRDVADARTQLHYAVKSIGKERLDDIWDGKKSSGVRWYKNEKEELVTLSNAFTLCTKNKIQPENERIHVRLEIPADAIYFCRQVRVILFEILENKAFMDLEIDSILNRIISTLPQSAVHILHARVHETNDRDFFNLLGRSELVREFRKNFYRAAPAKQQDEIRFQKVEKKQSLKSTLSNGTNRERAAS